MNHYERLGLPADASPADVHRAFRRAAQALHPDHHGDVSTPEMVAVNEAWRVLSDPIRRAAYDASLRLPQPPPVTVPPPPPIRPQDHLDEDPRTWEQESAVPYPPSGAVAGFRLLFVGWVVLAVAVMAMLFAYGFCRSGTGGL